VEADTCNPSYSEGRDWEAHGLKPAQAKSWRDPFSTNKVGYGSICLSSQLYGKYKQNHRPGHPRQKKSKILFKRITKKQKGQGVAQMLKHLPSKHKALRTFSG
jgi:hypothetical protein